MIDYLLGRPSAQSRRLQVLAVLSFWSIYLFKGHKHGPPMVSYFSRLASRSFTMWQTVLVTMLYLYAARNFSILVGLASPEPMSNMYSPAFFRSTWILTALDAGFWTAMPIRPKWLRDISSMVFSVFYLFAAEQADEKVRRVRGHLTVDHLRVSWDKGFASPYLRFAQSLLRLRLMRWQPRQVRIPRPAASDYSEPIMAWLYFDGPIADLAAHDKIVLDFPGGGFIAMSPRSNDDRLTSWASHTGLPVLSLDYKKAPEYPYPYSLNECFDAYVALVKSRGRCLGLSGKVDPYIVVTGDSAGGSLAAAITLMIIERNANPRFHDQAKIPVPAGLVLSYPCLDLNIGGWMTEEQMSLIRDRTLRNTNKRIARGKSMQYNQLTNTPHQSDDEDEPTSTPEKHVGRHGSMVNEDATISSPPNWTRPQPEYSHSETSEWNTTAEVTSALTDAAVDGSTGTVAAGRSTSHHPEPLRTRLAVSSVLSYFNDRMLTPEMMRAMIILYVGPHNRPDFARDYLLSPILAPDSLIAAFPKTCFLTGERDPLVDDTVIFAGRLSRVKAHHLSSSASLSSSSHARKDVEVFLVPGVSHGFLQFPSVYPPAWRLIKRQAQWIEEMLAEAEEQGEVKEEEIRGGGISRIDGASAEEEDEGDEGDRPRKPTKRVALDSSSGDEDDFLQMTVASTRKALTPWDTNSGTGGIEAQAKMKSRPNRSRQDNGSLVKLKSSEDLLGRRMKGLTRPLAGLSGHG